MQNRRTFLGLASGLSAAIATGVSQAIAASHVSSDTGESDDLRPSHDAHGMEPDKDSPYVAVIKVEEDGCPLVQHCKADGPFVVRNSTLGLFNSELVSFRLKLTACGRVTGYVVWDKALNSIIADVDHDEEGRKHYSAGETVCLAFERSRHDKELLI